MIETAPIEQTKAWLYRVAGNRIIDKSRKKTEQLYGSWRKSSAEGADFKEIEGILTAVPEFG